MDTVLYCLIRSRDHNTWKLTLLTNETISHPPPEMLTYEDEPPTFGTARQLLYGLLRRGFANQAEVSHHKVVFTGLVPFAHPGRDLGPVLEKLFRRPVMLTYPAIQPVANDY